MLIQDQVGSYSSNLKLNKKPVNNNLQAVRSLQPVQKAAPDVSFGQVLSFLGQKIQETVEKPLNLLYVSDTHSYIDRIPKLKTAVDQFRKRMGESVFIHAGDFGLGTGDLNMQVDLLNDIGVDFATLGNHEFFVGIDRLVSAMKKAKFKTIVSNLKIPQDSPMKELYDSKQIVKSKVKVINGKKYGFIGATTNDINQGGYRNHTQGVRSRDALEALSREVKAMEARGINRIVLISHLGHEVDQVVAENIPGIDVIVGGHSHISVRGLKDSINIRKSPRDNEPVVMLYCGRDAENLGVSQVMFNDKGVVQVEDENKSDVNFKNLLTKFFERKGIELEKTEDIPESTTNELIKVDKFSADKKLQEVLESKMELIGTAKKAIRAPWPKMGANHMGSLTADAVKDLTEADVAVLQPGCLIHGINKGPIYAERISNLAIPFNPDIVKVRLKGKDILKALNHGAKGAGTDIKPGLLQVSGLSYTVDMTRPEDKRVMAKDVIFEKDGKPLRLEQTYTVAFDKFLSRGGEGFDSFKKSEIVKNYEGKSYAQALIDYIKKYNNEPGRINPDFSNRIKVKG